VSATKHVTDTLCGFAEHMQWLTAKLEVGESYIQVWAPDNVRVPFPSIITL